MSFATWNHLSSKTGDLPVPFPSNQQTASLILDIDKDGINDFVLANRSVSPSVVWYQRTPSGWTRYVIDDSSQRIEAGGAFEDIDSDGDFDIVFGADAQSNKVWWWENPHPNFESTTPWVRREIKNSGLNKHHDQIFGDFDDDGQLELVFWNQKALKLFIANVPSDPKNTQPWPITEIYSWSGTEHEGLAKVDIDGDGVLDIVGGGRWFKHNGGTSYTANIIDNSQRFTRAAAGQLKTGGRPEVVFVIGDGVGRLKWYEWSGSTWIGSDILGFDVDHGHSLQVLDVDGDGNLDVFCAEMRLNSGNPDAKMWVLRGDGNGNFETTEVATGFGNHESKVGDLDGDGDMDILGKPFNWDAPRVDVWLQEGGFSLDSWERHVIDPNRPWRSVFITSADVDGDQRKDIVTGGWWYRNPGSPGGIWTRFTIGTPLNNMAVVHDFDGDGDVDVLGTAGVGSNPNSTFVWARNDGTGQFTILNNVSAGDGDFLQGVAIDRFQPGGPLEVALSWHIADKGVQMLTVPADPSSGTWAWRKIADVSQDEGLSAGDIDRDGDQDLFQGTKWLRNDNGTWTQFVANSVAGLPDRNRLADINQDGRLDAVFGMEAISTDLFWLEAPVDATQIWTLRTIATGVGGVFSMDVADMDNDGDVDVVLGEHKGATRLIVYENIDNGASWIPHTVDPGGPGIDHHDGSRPVDIDNDGDLDIISIGWFNLQVWLFENKGGGTGGSTVATPSITPDGGFFVGGVSVMLSTTTSGAEIRYTLDGSVPTQSSALFTGPIMLTSSARVSARAFKTGSTASSVAQTDFVISRGSGPRVIQSLQALYKFEEGSGSVVYDLSAVGSALDLTIESTANTTWGAGYLSLDSGTILRSSGAGTKLIDACKASHEITVETWIKPANLTQTGPARIVSVSADLFNRNFTIGQNGLDYECRLRTTTTGNNGTSPALSASNAVLGDLTHLVYTRDASGTAKLYVYANEVATRGDIGGDLSNWDDSYGLSMANEFTMDRPWLGEYHLVAIYSRALSLQEVSQNFNAGPDLVGVVLQLYAFSAAVEGNTVYLTWEATLGRSSLGFDIERSRAGGGFERLGFVESRGTTVSSSKYSFIDRDLAPEIYRYRLRQLEMDGSSAYSLVLEAHVGAPLNFELKPASPNPSNAETTIEFTIPHKGMVGLRIFDIQGKEVAVLIEKEMPAGSHFVRWNAQILSNGVYFLRLSLGHSQLVTQRKLVVLN